MSSAGGRYISPLVLAFIILHSSFFPSSSLGQVKGEVESIGFENYYRPDCWTQMVVRLTPETETAADYLICVHQQDMDRDRVVFTRQIALTGTDENGNGRDQRFRIYFKPTPFSVDNGGLPDASDITKNLASLQKVLSVELTTTAGKFVAALPITNTVMSLSPDGESRGSKLVLAVTDGRSVPPHREYDEGVTIGLLEDVDMVPVAPADLPENAIGYQAVDAILWLDPSAEELTAGGDERLRALQNYVRNGGHLVICQQTDQWQKTLAFTDLLPVEISGVRTKNDAMPLRALARGHEATAGGSFIDPWDFMSGPMTLGIATPRPGAMVDTWIEWPDHHPTPYIVRKPYGCGCVTWVAQDLGDRSLTSTVASGQHLETNHWPAIWNRVFNWHDDPLLRERISDAQKSIYVTESPGHVDLARELNDKTMELSNTGLWHISVAVIFFIVYWLVAGPGTFFFLLAKGKSAASWFAYAAAAIVFTVATLFIVNLVLRGSPELKQFAVVRVAGRQIDPLPQAHVYSRFGLYVKRDGQQSVEIKDAAPGTSADLSAYAIPPKDMGDKAPSDLGEQYSVPIIDAASGDNTQVSFPYRRSLKKLEASWTGDPTASGLSGGIEGIAHLINGTRPDGKLTNATGHKLHDVYFAYRYHSASTDPEDVTNLTDYLVYIPQWDAGATIDLGNDLRYETDKDGTVHPVEAVAADGANPGNGHKCGGSIERAWEPFWLKSTSATLGEENTLELHNSLIVLSLFDRLAPNRADDKGNRLEIFRRGGRPLDCSAALAAGSLVIIASEHVPASDPLPLPLDVNGDTVTGDGDRLYQFIVPIDYSADLAAAMAATTAPTTAPSQ
jgi:hypothetical protein